MLASISSFLEPVLQSLITTALFEPGYADNLQGSDRDVLKLRPGITGPATLKYRQEDEYLANARK